MSFPKYDAYKESGVEWLGDIPKHWETKRLKYVASLLTDKSNQRNNAVALENIEGWSGRFIPSKTEFAGDGVDFETDDILFGKLRPYLAKVWLAQFSGEAVGDFHVMRPSYKICGRYTTYLMLTRDFISIVDGSTFGAKMPRASWDFMCNMILPVPPNDEQTAIANFLDAETSKIDALVAEQRRLIELLKEKRQAVISHAVTKGLNPNAPMKDSGIEWLGDVPEHWEVKRLGHLGRLQNGLNIGGEAFGSGDPFVSYGDVYNNTNVPEIPSGLVQSTQSDQAKYNLEVGDVFFTRTSETIDDIGIASTCLCSIPRATFAGFLIRFRPIASTLDPLYSTYLFRNQGVQGHFAGTMNLVTRASLSQDVLKMLPICIPPIEEQQEIAAFIYNKLELFRSLIYEAEQAIELLQERRTALISAAVTGKIDVREYATQETA
ncbi:Type-1 restriction enzyme EcoKI specificity protein [Gimesia maris]|uniref:restriction endonuclease subunit S n=1 Tax=Gimesia maris TaxID=122 RepID=UPI00118C1445|nr:restriction endonuclease subunit S [Gimesia maris]QDU14727.1 Type-1 restriction enzyme EcoKI specificity protein [Gimesia maris]